MVTGRKLLLADDSATIQKVIDLTFSDEGLEVITVGAPERKPARETPLEHRINVIATWLLIATVIGLWIYFR